MASHSLQAMHLRNHFIRMFMPLFSRRVSSEAVLTSHSGRDGDLLVGEVDRELLSGHSHDRHPDAAEHVREEHILAGALQDYE